MIQYMYVNEATILKFTRTHHNVDLQLQEISIRFGKCSHCFSYSKNERMFREGLTNRD